MVFGIISSMLSKILIIGHRGSPLEAPENTIASFQKAIDIGVDGIELDIQRTSDDQLVVIHNAEFGIPNRDTNYVFDHPYSDLKKWLPDLLLFKEVIELCKSKVRMEVEIKRQDRQTLVSCLDIMSEYRIESDVEITSYHEPVLAEAKTRTPRIRTGLIFTQFPDWMEGRYREVVILDAMRFINADVAHLPTTILDESLVGVLQKNGLRVHAGNANSIEDIEKAIKLGVEQFTTNNPRLALEVYQKMSKN